MLVRYLQSNDFADDCTWWSTFSVGTDYANFESALQLANGNYILGGGVRLSSGADVGASLVSLASTGELNWVKAIHLSGYQLRFRQMLELESGLVAISSAQSPSDTRLFIIYFSIDGSVNWAKLIGHNYQTALYGGTTSAFIKTMSGHLAVVGSILQRSGAKNFETSSIVNLTVNGELGAAYLFGGSIVNRFVDIAMSLSGSIFLVGWEGVRYATLSSIILPNTIAFAKIFRGLQDVSQFKSVISTYENKLMLSAGGTGHWYLAMLNTNGTYVWGSYLQWGDRVSYITFENSLLQLDSGDFVFTGAGCYPDARPVSIRCNMVITSFNSVGNLLWSKSISSIDSDFLEIIVEDQNGYLWVCGNSNSPDLTSQKAFLAKLTPQGDIVFASDAIYQIENITLTAQSVPASVMQDWAVNPIRTTTMDVVDITDSLQVQNLSSPIYQLYQQNSSCATATASASSSASSSATPSATASPTASSSASSSTSSSVSASATASVTPSSSTSVTATHSPSITTSVTPSVSATTSVTPSSSASVTATQSPSVTASGTPSVSATTSVTPSLSATVSGTSTVSPSSTATTSSSLTASSSVTESITASPTATASGTATATLSQTSTSSVTSTASSTASFTATPSDSLSVSATDSATASASVSPLSSLTASSSLSPTMTASPTLSSTASVTGTLSATATPSAQSVTDVANNAGFEMSAAVTIAFASAAALLVISLGVYFYYVKPRYTKASRSKGRARPSSRVSLWRQAKTGGPMQTEMIVNPLNRRNQAAPAGAIL